MTSVSFGGSGSQFQSLDRALGYSDGLGDEDDLIDIDEETYEYLTNHYFRAGHDGCDEYTNLTTFHGMIRVFNSRNCPSLIFWCLVVATCLVFYIIVCGSMISSYSTQPTFMRINETKNHRFENDVELCSRENLSCLDVNTERQKFKCENKENNCVSIRFSTKIKIRLKKKGLYFKHGTESEIHYLISRPHVHHKIRLKVFQIERLNLRRAECTTTWDEIFWLPEKYWPNLYYSLKSCEDLRYNITDQIAGQQINFPCRPACFETQYKVSHSQSHHSSDNVLITLSVLPNVTNMQETRKTTIIDILCYLGGASSLFMGCSCVTLMEMFVFLLKLVTGSACSSDPPTLDDTFYQDKLEFEYSDQRNKRRYAIFDKETMEKYLRPYNSTEVHGINLEKRVSVFSMRKAPKLISLKDNKNFDKIDFYDEGNVDDSVEEELLPSSPREESLVDYQDEKLDTLGDTLMPVEPKRSRPPLRRCSTATSYASLTSKASSSLTARTVMPIRQNRRMSRAFTRNMPMNDF